MGLFFVCSDVRQDAYSIEEEHCYIRHTGLDFYHTYRDVKNRIMPISGWHNCVSQQQNIQNADI